MRKVYICSPYRAKDGAELDRNIDYAQQLTRQALEAGLAPITPHLYMTQCMLISLVFMLAIDVLIKINLIGFIPEQARTYLGLDTVGVAEFFALLYIAYEVVSIFKNMALCGLPVKKVWEKVREFLAKYTDELPDTDELDGDSTTGNVEEHRTQER